MRGVLYKMCLCSTLAWFRVVGVYSCGQSAIDCPHCRYKLQRFVAELDMEYFRLLAHASINSDILILDSRSLN